MRANTCFIAYFFHLDSVVAACPEAGERGTCWRRTGLACGKGMWGKGRVDVLVAPLDLTSITQLLLIAKADHSSFIESYNHRKIRVTKLLGNHLVQTPTAGRNISF